MELDLSGDLLLVDGLQPVSIRLAGEAFDRPVPDALRRDVSVREVAASNGDYRLGDTRWHLPTCEFCREILPGTTITDGDGTVWTVLTVGKQTLSTRWACTARAIEITAGLSQTISIERMVLGKGEHGQQVIESWSPLYAGVRAKIQPQSTDMEGERSRRTARVTHTVYVAAQVTLKEKDRIRCGDRKFGVRAVRNAERIDLLTEIDVEEDLWPV